MFKVIAFAALLAVAAGRPGHLAPTYGVPEVRAVHHVVPQVREVHHVVPEIRSEVVGEEKTISQYSHSIAHPSPVVERTIETFKPVPVPVPVPGPAPEPIVETYVAPAPVIKSYAVPAPVVEAYATPFAHHAPAPIVDAYSAPIAHHAPLFDSYEAPLAARTAPLLGHEYSAPLDFSRSFGGSHDFLRFAGHGGYY